MNKSIIEKACARADKRDKLIKHAVASLEWKKREKKKLGLDPKNHVDRAFFEEINE